MNDVLAAIIEVERECAETLAAKKSDHDAVMHATIDRLETRRKEEKKRIALENGARLRRDVDDAEREIGRDLSVMRNAMGGLRENKDLCNEVREKVISILFIS